MNPFFSGIAIGLVLSAAIYIIGAAIFLICLIVVVPSAFSWATAIELRSAVRKEGARIAAIRAENGLPPRLSFWAAQRVAWQRLMRILRHPIRERAFITESCHALSHPNTHRWSDGLS